MNHATIDCMGLIWDSFGIEIDMEHEPFAEVTSPVRRFIVRNLYIVDERFNRSLSIFLGGIWWNATESEDPCKRCKLTESDPQRQQEHLHVQVVFASKPVVLRITQELVRWCLLQDLQGISRPRVIPTMSFQSDTFSGMY